MGQAHRDVDGCWWSRASCSPPVLLGLAALLGLTCQEKTVERSGACVERLQLLRWRVSGKGFGATGWGACAAAPLKDSRGLGCSIAISGSNCSGFTIHREHGAASAFAQQLAPFLDVPFQDDVPTALRITRGPIRPDPLAEN